MYVDYEGSNQVHLSVSGAARYIILRISSKSLSFIQIFRNGGWSGGASGTTSGGYNGATPVSFSISFFDLFFDLKNQPN